MAYLPVLAFAAAAAALLFATAADRAAQWGNFKNALRMLRRRARGMHIGHLRRIRPRRAVFWLLVLYLLSYIAVYQRVQDALAGELARNGIEEVAVGSLIIPHSAFFRRAYTADAGFSKSKTRARAEVAVRGSVWSGFDIAIDESGLAKIGKLAGKKFVFSYLTDVKILRPAIHAHMRQLQSAGQIEKYEIETFDNRGPYLIVALAADGADAQAAASQIAGGLHTKLTRTDQLKVNQVVVKVVEPAAYLSGGGINILARGTAGNY
ncbi:MAG: hypothetical protein MPJ83_04970 [Gammaproteobacteria bacterium]|nr:hypothetical protein [Gammaproteobacteria bacterium]